MGLLGGLCGADRGGDSCPWRFLCSRTRPIGGTPTLAQQPHECRVHRLPLTQTSPTPQAEIAGAKYRYINSDEETMYLRKGGDGVCFFKLNTCVIVAQHNDKVQPGECRMAVQRLADYLKENGI